MTDPAVVRALQTQLDEWTIRAIRAETRLAEALSSEPLNALTVGDHVKLIHRLQVAEDKLDRIYRLAAPVYAVFTHEILAILEDDD